MLLTPIPLPERLADVAPSRPGAGRLLLRRPEPVLIYAGDASGRNTACRSFCYSPKGPCLTKDAQYTSTFLDASQTAVGLVTGVRPSGVTFRPKDSQHVMPVMLLRRLPYGLMGLDAANNQNSSRVRPYKVRLRPRL